MRALGRRPRAVYTVCDADAALEGEEPEAVDPWGRSPGLSDLGPRDRYVREVSAGVAGDKRPCMTPDPAGAQEDRLGAQAAVEPRRAAQRGALRPTEEGLRSDAGGRGTPAQAANKRWWALPSDGGARVAAVVSLIAVLAAVCYLAARSLVSARPSAAGGVAVRAHAGTAGGAASLGRHATARGVRASAVSSPTWGGGAPARDSSSAARPRALDRRRGHRAGRGLGSAGTVGRPLRSAQSGSPAATQRSAARKRRSSAAPASRGDLGRAQAPARPLAPREPARLEAAGVGASNQAPPKSATAEFGFER